MTKVLIKNGLVFDPLNNIEGKKKDILIEDGLIVDNFSNQNEINEINASGKTIIPAALDIHTHIASQQTNWARLLGRSNNKFKDYWKGLTLENIARDYISNGYTFILEANVFPSLSKQTIFDLKQLPVLDKAMLLNVSNLWPIELEYQKGKMDEMSTFLSDLLTKTKGFGLKVYNPFECETWNFHTLRDSLSELGRLYNFSALDVYENLAKCNSYLSLPHSLHGHIEGYEHEMGKDNLKIVLERIKNANIDNPHIFHLAHASAYNNDGVNTELIKFLNENQGFDIDLGIIGFDPVNPLITSDKRLAESIIKARESEPFHKMIRSAIEFEGDSFVAIRSLSKNDEKACIQWANSIDLALNIKNKHQVSLSFNFPNYSHVNNLAEIATYLVSDIARKEFMNGINTEFLSKTSLKDNLDVLTFNEFVIITRASPAKSLGLESIKGNLGVGADGDLNILNIDINELDLKKDYIKFKNALSNIEYVIKSGEIVKKNNDIKLNTQGKIFWSNGKAERAVDPLIMKKKRAFYEKYYSIFYESLNISIDNKYLRKIS